MNKSEQLIACLEGEIAKRDEELSACRVAVENCEVFRARIVELEEKSSAADDADFNLRGLLKRGAFALGLDPENTSWFEVIGDLEQLRAELAALKAQEPVAWAGAIEGGVPLLMVEPQNWKATPLYAAPVSEAKAQGAVMPERWNVPRPMWKDARQPYGNPLNHADIEAAEKFNLALDEVSRLNAAPVQQVSVPDGCKACKACKGTGRRPIGGRGRIFGLTNRCFECQPLTAEEVYGTGDSHDQ